MLPGWSFMPDIFARVDLHSNLIFPQSPLVSSINHDICRIMGRLQIQKIHIVGWSLGAISASLFASAYPELTESLCLISVMRPFETGEAEEVLKGIREDKKRALLHFHRLCFTGQQKDYRWFRESGLQEAAIGKWDISLLEQGLFFITENPFDPSAIEGIPAVYFHGKRDIVSPLETAPPRSLENFNVIRAAGHLPFLSEEFRPSYEQFQQAGHSRIFQQGGSHL